MDKLQQIKLPIDKEFEEFRRLFDSSLQSSNSLL
ncbi:polyprenyl synthetase family protein, partial [Phocaeicola vulgatus]|nr:polyprenyl synthetase family protein [Phocaeicola vulgatus]